MGIYTRFRLDADVKVMKPANILPLLISGGVDVARSGAPMQEQGLPRSVFVNGVITGSLVPL
jgi:hypothetical protein